MTSKQPILKNTVKPAFAHFCEFETMLKKRGKAPEMPINTITTLNRKIWGLQRQHLYVIGSYTSHGKSSFCLQIARDLAQQDFGVVYLSLEMRIEKCLERFMCQSYSIPNTDLLSGKWNSYTDQILQFKENLKTWRLAITDCIGYTWQEVDRLIEKMTTKPDVIILDYAQITKRTAKNQKDDFDEYIKHFREMAIRHNFCAVLVSQIGRAAKQDGSKDPQLHHLSGSSLFEVHADYVILLKWNYRETEKEEDFNRYTVYVSKNRDGATGYFDLHFRPECYLFSDVEKEIDPPTEEHAATEEMFQGQTIHRKDWSEDE